MKPSRLISVCALMGASLTVIMARSIRLYAPSPLAAGGLVTLPPEQAHYVSAVMRLSVGASVALFNAEDGEWQGRIVALRRDRAEIAIAARLRPPMPTETPDLWLVFALLKRQATDLVIQKATELGVAAIFPVITARGIGERVNLARLLTIATEAAEQCERLSVPKIAPPEPLSDLLAAWPPGRPLVAALERVDCPPIMPIAGPAALLIGPEGGFTPAELDVLRAHPFLMPATLGPRILRAETAAIAGLALLQAAR